MKFSKYNATQILRVLTIVLLVSLNNVAPAQDTITDEDTSYVFDYGVSYVGEFANNVSGGIKRGSIYMGNAYLWGTLYTDNWWKGGVLYTSILNTHGKGFSAEYVGDFQVASNIEAEPGTVLYELKYEQTIGNLSILTGLIDANESHFAGENASNFSNSTFGISSVLSNGVPVSIFPYTGVGISFQYKLSPKFNTLLSVYDGLSYQTETENHNLKWNLKKMEGTLWVSEWQWHNFGKKTGNSIKTGVYHHTPWYAYNDSSQVYDIKNSSNTGLYLITDFSLAERQNQKTIDVFGQLFIDPNKRSENYLGFCAGINAYGLLTNDFKDTWGMGVCYAGFNSQSNEAETAIEFYNLWQINDYIALQADFQYVINPSGTDTDLENASLIFFRFMFDW